MRGELPAGECYRVKARVMREKNILFALLALNLALLVTFSSYLVLSMQERRGENLLLPRIKPQRTPSAPAAVPSPRSDPYVLEMASVIDRAVTFRDVETRNYQAYLGALRRAGCPTQHLRHIVLADVDELFAQKRLEEAIRHDFEWWRADFQPIVAGLLREKGQELAEQQQQLTQKLLGPPGLVCAPFWTHVPLTGAVLGALSEKLHVEVQEICRQTMASTAADPAETINLVAVARAREQMRSELLRVLSGEQLEEFLLRYSQQAVALRRELSELQPSADEFRKTFNAVEPIDRELQLEFGSIEALAEGQRERYQRRRTEAVKGALAPERYAAYVLAHNAVP